MQIVQHLGTTQQKMHKLGKRSLSSSTSIADNFSQQQEFILQLVALVASGISIIAGAFALYWFFRIKTHFRHQLVTFLICSDLSKAIWYFVSAALALKLNPVRFSDNFCQASGFFLSSSLEASDYAILVIAIHSALCIFRPNTNLGETGLFGIRYIVYALWITLPILAAGLGLLNGGAYIDTGAYCWLPVRPQYYRLALSWIPRYIVFLTILCLYAWIYWFVSARFKNFHVSDDDSYKRPAEAADVSVPRSRGVISRILGAKSMSDKATNSRKTSDHVDQEMTRISTNPPVDEISADDERPLSGPTWENYTFGSSLPLSGPRDGDATPPPLQSGLESINEASTSTHQISLSDTLAGDVHKSLMEFLKEEPPEGFISAPRLRPGLVTEEVSNETKARQTAIKRQLRFVFVYPICYLIFWIPPLVQHFTVYNDDIAAHPSFPLACISTICLSLQCFMDSVIFSYRETPWRYLRTDAIIPNRDHTQSSANVRRSSPGSNSWLSFWRKSEPTDAQDDVESLHQVPDDTFTTVRNALNDNSPDGLFIHRLRNIIRIDRGGSLKNRLRGSFGKFFLRRQGKSQGEMIAEARAARRRRELEISTARESQQERQRQRKQSILRRGGAERSWWEVEGRKRKDSVLLGLDQDLSRTKSRGSTDGANVTRPSLSITNGFSTRRLRGSIASSPVERSLRTRLSMTPEEMSPVEPRDSLEQGSRNVRFGNATAAVPATQRDIIESMPTVIEESGPAIAANRD